MLVGVDRLPSTPSLHMQLSFYHSVLWICREFVILHSVYENVYWRWKTCTKIKHFQGWFDTCGLATELFLEVWNVCKAYIKIKYLSFAPLVFEIFSAWTAMIDKLICDAIMIFVVYQHYA